MDKKSTLPDDDMEQPAPLEVDDTVDEKFTALINVVDQLHVMQHPSQLCLSKIPSITNFKIVHTPMFEKVIPHLRKSKEFARRDELKVTLCDQAEEKGKKTTVAGEDEKAYRKPEGVLKVEIIEPNEEKTIESKTEAAIEEGSKDALDVGDEDNDADDELDFEHDAEIQNKLKEAAKTESEVPDLMEAIKDKEPSKAAREKPNTFMTINLRTSEDICGFSQCSSTVPRISEEAEKVEEDNKHYEFLTTGRGRIRRRSEAETQTKLVLLKSRDINTDKTFTGNRGSYVSTYDMWKTFEETQSDDFSDSSVSGQEEDPDVPPLEDDTEEGSGSKESSKLDYILSLSSFQLCMMKVTRILAGGEYGEAQRRYRNMVKPNPLVEEIDYKYRLTVLFQMKYEPPTENTRIAISDISFCASDADILAIGYGTYALSSTYFPDHGQCCIWNIKNPVNPERVYDYPKPVVAVEFSPSQPHLLAIGLYDGSVEVRNICNFDDPAIACSSRTELATIEPITSIKWLPIDDSAEAAENEDDDIQPFLALSQDGSVTKYRLINSPTLLSFKQMQLQRVEGSPEGLYTKRPWQEKIQSNRQPQGLNLVLHPIYPDIFFALTDEGCLHMCSTNYPHQHLDVFQTHHASVSVMDFSPFSPKLFLTCGNDWCIRVWLVGIHKPLITLKDESAPIHCAAWSLTHSTVIVSNTRTSIQIWDIRRDLLKPCSLKTLDKAYLTMFKFSPCGRSLIIGNERGYTVMLAFEDMPFPPHFQYDALQEAIYKAVGRDLDLLDQVKALGNFGYEEKKAESDIFSDVTSEDQE